MKCGTNARILESNRDGIALCLECGFRAAVVLTYNIMSRTPEIRIPPIVPSGQTVPAPAIFCVTCRGPAWVRTSQRVSSALKLIRVYCLDETCGQRVNAFLQLTEQLAYVPGAKQTGIPYQTGLIEALRRDLEDTNTLPRFIHER